MRALCIIPARYASTRLPGKPLREIAGVPMICRVYERASMARRVEQVLVATDDERICNAVKGYGGNAMMTAKDHPTGTDRLAEAASAYPEMDLVINVQGDEPLIEPSLIDELVGLFEDAPDLQMATVMTEIAEDEAKNPNNVKVVTDKAGYALYFSRSLLPYPRNPGKAPVFKHIGIYAYRRDFLLQYKNMPPTPLEQAESLEQLRALEHGYRIRVLKTDCKFVGVDTEEDLALADRIYREMENGKAGKEK